MRVDLCQRCVISSWLYNLFMDRVMRVVNARALGQWIRYAVCQRWEAWEVSQSLVDNRFK